VRRHVARVSELRFRHPMAGAAARGTTRHSSGGITPPARAGYERVLAPLFQRAARVPARVLDRLGRQAGGSLARFAGCAASIPRGSRHHGDTRAGAQPGRQEKKRAVRGADKIPCWRDSPTAPTRSRGGRAAIAWGGGTWTGPRVCGARPWKRIRRSGDSGRGWLRQSTGRVKTDLAEGYATRGAPPLAHEDQHGVISHVPCAPHSGQRIATRK